MPTLAGTSHVDLTVSDLDRSIAFYQKILDMTQLARLRSEENKFEVAYLGDPRGMIIGLVKHDAGNGAGFDPRVTGLDHLSFAVTEREQLKDWARHLESAGVAHSGVTDQPPFGAGLNFEDPDGIALEIYYVTPNLVPAK